MTERSETPERFLPDGRDSTQIPPLFRQFESQRMYKPDGGQFIENKRQRLVRIAKKMRFSEEKAKPAASGFLGGRGERGRTTPLMPSVRLFLTLKREFAPARSNLCQARVK